MRQLVVDVALDRGSFRLAVRESFDLAGITAIFGASGSGKTSLLRVIAGLEPAARGRISFAGDDWLGAARVLPPEDRAVGYVFQDGRLFAHLDVRGNLEFPLRRGRRGERFGFDETVAALDLEGLLPRHPAGLSGGERQRVAIGRALLAGPALLLMDEPLSSIDIARKRELMPLIRSLPARFELPILYVTHNLDELSYLADSVVLLAGGRNVARGSARQLLERHDLAELAGVDEPGAILEAEITGQTGTLTIAAVGTESLRLPRTQAPVGTRMRLRVDPRDVILAIEPPRGISIRNHLAALIESLDQRGDGLVSVRLAVADQRLTARITADAARELELREGQRIIALIKTVALSEIAG